MRSLIGWLAFLIACTPAPQGPTLKPGTPAFVFEHKKVDSITLSKNDLRSGDHWTVDLERKATEDAEPDWRITGGLGSPKDDRADGRYLQHLLDTLTTLRAFELAPRGGDEAFGLDHPKYWLRWKVGSNQFELKVGQLHSEKDSSEYAQLSTDPKVVWKIQGAALQLLEYLSSIDSVRLRTLLTWSLDEVDLFEFGPSRAKPWVRAEREGVQWRSLSAPKKLIPEAPAWLESIAHLQIKRFIDDPITLTPLYTFEAEDRSRNRLQIEVGVQTGQVLARTSSRPGALFELYPESLKYFAALSSKSARQSPQR